MVHGAFWMMHTPLATRERQKARRASGALAEEFAEAASAFPPGVSEAEARACRYVLENAGVACRGGS